MIKEKLKKSLNLFFEFKKGFSKYKKLSYSQTGEDLIIDFIFEQLNVQQPSYLDLGAHHPFYLSNTYLFYKKGGKGVNVEPDPFLIKRFRKSRKNDINLNVGIGFNDSEKIADFYIMSARALNTFSKEEAIKVQNYGTYKIEQTVKVPILSVNKIIEEYFPSTCPNFISIDVEGLDYEIIKSFDFNKFRPDVFCIETITYTEDKSEHKIREIYDYLSSKGYFAYADTYINTIFVNTLRWKSR